MTSSVGTMNVPMPPTIGYATPRRRPQAAPMRRDADCEYIFHSAVQRTRRCSRQNSFQLAFDRRMKQTAGVQSRHRFIETARRPRR